MATQTFFFECSSLFGEMVQFDKHIFQMGLVQPPSSVAKSWRFFGGFGVDDSSLFHRMPADATDRMT